MLIYKQELFLTIIVFAVMTLVIFITKRAIRRFSFVKAIDVNRRKIIFNLSYLLIYITGGSFLAIIWGVDHRQFALFISSILAVLGVGFFAQWSILSNLTASVILFFSHPMRIGDRIRVLDKDFEWTGKVIDITGFYLFMKTDDERDITLPTSLVMQKGIEILKTENSHIKESEANQY
ncbi:mechanosensitive ion channel family protein [Aquimarina algiphila]|uniref:Mechanosensitive ion channel family protein n=1 Tax=Aquimarina algiphila TaxID=2047982 RepID=A0A554VLV1_9FLAO|nr:mechanosensitive ion channel family protein [Aquimarina algiphila]TSE09164.1 mechanosensitive ion channel family protein [Aquimarina algiphila]